MQNVKTKTEELIEDIIKNFNPHSAKNEDDIKIRTYADIILPIIRSVNPNLVDSFSSEKTFYKGGRADASFTNLVFEYKHYKAFDEEAGILEALYGRPRTKDHGLKDYIKSISEYKESDPEETKEKKLTSSYGIGFDGKSFLFARFAKSFSDSKLEFKYDKVSFKEGLYYLILLFKQEQKMALTKNNLLSIVNPNTIYVKESIKALYSDLEEYVFTSDPNKISPRSKTLYDEWNRVFGKIYGKESEETEFTEVTPAIKDAYNISEDEEINYKWFLFSLQTFMNIFLKLLVNSFLSDLVNPSFNSYKNLTKVEIIGLFMGQDKEQNSLVDNFFEAHYLEWFIFSKGDSDVSIVNDTLKIIEKFDLTSFVLKPEALQDIFEELYMELIPDKMRHIMGEYFSPDWIVEHTLNQAGFTGEDINKTLVDPTCGSGNFIIQALKRIISNNENVLKKTEIDQICKNIVGFDINPISVVAAKANYIIAIFSAYFASGYNYNENEWVGAAVDIPIYIADSVLAPIVYSEASEKVLLAKTSIGDFVIPKFENINKANKFLKLLSKYIHELSFGKFDIFWNIVEGEEVLSHEYKEVSYQLFKELYKLHVQGNDSFWPIILKNSFAPLIIQEKFDYVVGNPPWIAWKSMSQEYREGTLDVWLSYGIFEKNAYDKKTTHDDFGMAVVYVAMDQYLKKDGKLAFLLPASFLKSTKGGQGFRKFEITRNYQYIPFSVKSVDDFSGVNLFTIPTILVVFEKGNSTKYPFKNYLKWEQLGGKRKIDSHSTWKNVEPKLNLKKQIAQPINPKDKTSAWLTIDLEFYDIANKITNSKESVTYKGRKGVEPAGAKGVYVLKEIKKRGNQEVIVTGDFSRQRRKDIKDIGERTRLIEEKYVYPMLGGRNLDKWRVKSFEFMLIPHDLDNLYGIPELDLAKKAPKTFEYLKIYEEPLLASRIQNGKFFNPSLQPFYRLDNIGKYTFAKYKVLWKEQTQNFASVAVDTFYNTLPDCSGMYFDNDKPFVIDSKVLMLECESMDEAYYISGVLNSPIITSVIDGYAISTNRGTDVLQNIRIPKFNIANKTHKSISDLSKELHILSKSNNNKKRINKLERMLDPLVMVLFGVSTENN